MRSRLAALGVLMVFWSNAASAEALRVVASIKPLQSLAAGVMLGVGQPDVLIKGGGSAHAYSLRPSDARMLADADVILWIGPRFETFLQRPLALGKHAQAVMLSETPGLKLLATRDAGLWSAKEQVSAESDGHIWLDPGNAKIIVAAIAEMSRHNR